MWLVTGDLVDAIWRTAWVLLHVEIDQAEADAINAAVRAVAREAFPGADVEDVESPVIHVGNRLCLKAWGRSVQTIRNRDDEELLSVKAGAKIALKVALRPYRDPTRGLRVTAFPGRIDVLRAANKAKKPLSRKEQSEVRAKNVADRAATKAGLQTEQRADKTLTQTPAVPKPAKTPRSKPAPAAVIIPFPASTTKH